MNILLADTSSSKCITGMANMEKIICENTLDNGKTHSENFMPLIEKTISESEIELDNIDSIAVVVGPGSFTGIRIGIASIKAIAEVKNIKIIPVNSLEALAGNEAGNNEHICSLIDARNNQVYMGLFSSNISLQEELMADDINVCLEKIKKYNNICFVGNGATLHKEKIAKMFEEKNIVFSEKNEQTAEGLWIVAVKKAKNGEFFAADEIIPTYLRKSQAERLKK